MLAAACGRSDGTIESDARAQLEGSPVTKGLNLAPAVQKGIVSLSGQTQTHEQRERATEIVRAVEGVKEVVAQITVADDSLAEAVKQALARDPVVGGIPIDVEVVDKGVRLKSAATNADQRKRAVAVTREVPGVEGVDDMMK